MMEANSVLEIVIVIFLGVLYVRQEQIHSLLSAMDKSDEEDE